MTQQYPHYTEEELQARIIYLSQKLSKASEKENKELDATTNDGLEDK